MPARLGFDGAGAITLLVLWTKGRSKTVFPESALALIRDRKKDNGLD
jgi:hypothetical protein